MPSLPLSQRLTDGSLGVCATLPPSVNVRLDEARHFEFTDSTGMRWTALLEPLAIDLSERHEDERRRDVEETARAILAYVHRSMPPPPLPDGVVVVSGRPRSEDPDWSPVVDHEVVEVDGVRALRVIHRTMAHAGGEIVMGHLVLPLRGHVLELRTIVRETQLGLRECLLMATALRDGRPAMERTVPPQSAMDDRAFDGLYPDHCLSRTRAALARLVTAGALRYTQRPLDFDDPIRVVRKGWDVPASPRFMPAAFASTDDFHLTRMTFAVSDGRWSLIGFTRRDEDPRDEPSLRRVTRGLFEKKCGFPAPEEAVSCETTPGGGARCRIDLAEDQRHGPIAAAFWRDDAGAVRGMLVSGSPSTELALARSYLDETLARSTPAPYPLDAAPRGDDTRAPVALADAAEPRTSAPAVAQESTPPRAAPVAALVVGATFALAALSNLPLGQRVFAALVAVAVVASMVLTRQRCREKGDA